MSDFRKKKNLSQAKSNYNQMNYHRPVKGLKGAGVQISMDSSDKLRFQIAKQLTENSRERKATFAWSDNTKNIQFVLSADEIHQVVTFIKNIYHKAIKLFDQNLFSQKNYTHYSKAEFKHFPNGASAGKTIEFYAKDYNNTRQLVMKVRNSKNLIIQYSWNPNDFFQLCDVFEQFKSNALMLDNGWATVITDDKDNILKETILPSYSTNDYLNISGKDRKIIYKRHLMGKNLVHYVVE